MAEVRILKGFEDDLDAVESDRVLMEILHVVSILEMVPTLGSSDMPRSIALEFGNTVRKVPVSSFDIITEYRKGEDAVYVLGLVHQRAVW